MATKDINEAIQSLSGQAWGLVSKLTGKGYENTEAQLRDMVRVGELATSLITLRAAKRAMDAIPDRDGTAQAPKRKPGRPATVAVTPPSKDQPKETTRHVPGTAITVTDHADGSATYSVPEPQPDPATEGYLPDFESLGASDALAEGMDLSGEDK